MREWIEILYLPEYGEVNGVLPRMREWIEIIALSSAIA